MQHLLQCLIIEIWWTQLVQTRHTPTIYIQLDHFPIESEDENTWAVFTSFDYIIKNFQVSIGVLSNFDEKLQIYQEIKFFPPGISHYLAVFFDYRYSFGLVEQISPNKSFGFRLSAGFKFILPFELTYQGFPPFTEEEWKHELFFNIPFSF